MNLSWATWYILWGKTPSSTANSACLISSVNSGSSGKYQDEILILSWHHHHHHLGISRQFWGRSLNIRYIAQPDNQMLIAPNSEPICPTLHPRNAELRQVFMAWSPIIVKTKNVECWFFSRKKDTFLHYLVSPSSRGVTGKIRVLPVAGVILPLLVLGDAHPLLTSHLDRHLLLTFQISNQPNMFFHIDWA